MYNFLTKNGQLIALLFGIFCVIIFFGVILSGLSSAGYSMSDDLNEIMKQDEDVKFGFFNIVPILIIILVAFALVVWLAFSVFQLVSAPKKAIRFLIGIGIVLLLFIIFFSISQSETTGKLWELMQERKISDGASKMISGGLKTTLTLVVLAVGAIVVSEVMNIFK